MRDISHYAAAPYRLVSFSFIFTARWQRSLSASAGGFRTLNLRMRMRMRELSHGTQSIRARIAEPIIRVSLHKQYTVPNEVPDVRTSP